MKEKYNFNLVSLRKNTGIGLFISCLIILFCVSITHAQDLPPCWENDDVGDVASGGEAYFTDDIFTVSGSGADIYGTADAFHFAYMPSDGDCYISAQITSITNTAPDAKACLMIRETLEPGSRHAFNLLTFSMGNYYQYRLETDASSSNTNGKRPHEIETDGPLWLKLEREDDDFIGYYSEDGEEWVYIDTIVIEMEYEAYIGLAVTAHNNDGSLCEVTFENVEVETGIECEEGKSSIEKLTADDLFVYPNPMKDILTVEISKYHYIKNNTISIHNSHGQIIMTKKVTHKINTIDLSNIPRGLYFISLKNEIGNIVKKMIKE